MTEKIIFEEGNEEEQGEVFFATAHEYIQSAVLALESTDGIDTIIMTKTDEKRINRIRRQSLRLISFYINELYEETFDNSDDNSDD